MEFSEEAHRAFGEVKGRGEDRVQVRLNSVVAAAGLPIICRVFLDSQLSQTPRPE